MRPAGIALRNRAARGHATNKTKVIVELKPGAKIIIFAWVNDANTLRTYGSKSDAYAVYKSMLDKGNPPEDWAALIAQSQELEGG